MNLLILQHLKSLIKIQKKKIEYQSLTLFRIYTTVYTYVLKSALSYGNWEHILR